MMIAPLGAAEGGIGFRRFKDSTRSRESRWSASSTLIGFEGADDADVVDDFGEFGFRIEKVELAGGAGHEKVDDVFGFSREMGNAGEEGEECDGGEATNRRWIGWQHAHSHFRSASKFGKRMDTAEVAGARGGVPWRFLVVAVAASREQAMLCGQALSRWSFR
jgi:hypothetical protein